jgi:hypothetical protein
MSIHTLGGQWRIPGFFTEDNVNTLSQLITDTIAQSYTGKKVVVPNPHIVRIMQHIHEQRPESIPKMNERVIMNIVAEFIDFVNQNERNNNWSYFRYDAYNRTPNTGLKPYEKPKLKGEGYAGRGNTYLPPRFYFSY